MIEFIINLKIWALDETEATDHACEIATNTVKEFADHERINVFHLEVNPHPDGYIKIAVEFVAFVTSEDLCLERDNQIHESFQAYLSSRGYKPRLIYPSIPNR